MDSTSVSRDFPSSTVITPSRPALVMAPDTSSATCLSKWLETRATWK